MLSANHASQAPLICSLRHAGNRHLWSTYCVYQAPRIQERDQIRNSAWDNTAWSRTCPHTHEAYVTVRSRGNSRLYQCPFDLL